jgi:hypothetical protein
MLRQDTITTEVMTAKIGELVDISDLESVTAKVIHKKLEDHFGQPLDKQIVKELVARSIAEQTQTAAVRHGTIYNPFLLFCASRRAALEAKYGLTSSLLPTLGVTHKDVLRTLGAEWKASSSEAKAMMQAAFQNLPASCSISKEGDDAPVPGPARKLFRPRVFGDLGTGRNANLSIWTRVISFAASDLLEMARLRHVSSMFVEACSHCFHMLLHRIPYPPSSGIPFLQEIFRTGETQGYQDVGSGDVWTFDSTKPAPTRGILAVLHTCGCSVLEIEWEEIGLEDEDGNSGPAYQASVSLRMPVPVPAPLEGLHIGQGMVLPFAVTSRADHGDLVFCHGDEPSIIKIDGTGTTTVDIQFSVVYTCDEVEAAFWEVYHNHQVKSAVFEDVIDAFQDAVVCEGVMWFDGAVPPPLVVALRSNIDALADSTAPDYHPGSNNMVLDLVHPALFAYVGGVSPLHDDARVPRPVQHDSWGRKFENSRYQWLPSTFDVALDGKVEIRDYINNLSPRSSFEPLYGDLASLFSAALPLLEMTYNYGLDVVRKMRGDQDHEYYEPQPGQKWVSLKGAALQVIPKIVEYQLGEGGRYEGVWHVEGMSHERIVATALYILDRSPSIAGGDIMFKRAFFTDECGSIEGMLGGYWANNSHVSKVIDGGLLPLGRVATPEGRLICFPNSHVHRVDEMLAKDVQGAAGDKARRRIVVFFLVDPSRRIISTEEVPPQQKAGGGEMSLDEAKEHRLQLMHERKFQKQDWNARFNQRELSLCEH